MNFCICFVLLVAVALIAGGREGFSKFPQLSHLKSKASPETQAKAAEDLIRRLINERASEFVVKIDTSIGPKDKDTFMLSSSDDGSVQILGTSGVAVAMGFYHYLKYYCHGQRTWAGQQTQLPPTLPLISTPITITTNDMLRYYQNVCTESYTMAFWDWDRWEQEIDWMALHGINLPLAFVGQEAIFQRVYLSMNFTQEDLDAHFGGPAFLAWARMGNIKGWGGPLPQMWITNKLLLQHKILDRMRSLGMIPVLPAFAGHVPSAITRVFPQANVTKLSTWGHFNNTFSGTYLLNFDDPLFIKIGKAFIENMYFEFGIDHIYNADTFNEMQPTSSDPGYLQRAGQSVYKSMVAGDPMAIWLMQGWLFTNREFWKPPQIKALLTSIPQGRMIILDLAAETEPFYSVTESFYGQPFIWCMLHNFGGTMELYGAVDAINKPSIWLHNFGHTMDLYGAVDAVNRGPFQGRQFPNSTMIGIGLTPEGIHQNEVMYEFMMENSWRTEPRDINSWVESFAHQRYGIESIAVNSAWKTLMKSVFNATDNHRDHNQVNVFKRPDTRYRFVQDRGVYNAPSNHRDFDNVLITKRPRPDYDVTSDMWYKPEDLFSAWDNFITASSDLQGSSLFRYDIADVTRNSLQVIALTFYSTLIKAFKQSDTSMIKIAGNKITDLLKDMDHLLSSNERFLVGIWIADAKAWATDANETKLLEYNARNQITLWGPGGEIHDYASKQWANVIADYYCPRWTFFTQWLIQLVENGTSWNTGVFNDHILPAVESPWTLSSYPYPTKPSGNPIAIAKELHAKYRPVSKDPFFNTLWEPSHKERVKKSQSLYFRKFSYDEGREN